ncbi:hypothetical protein PVK06_027866 [Gossypium arboreum]|uniref:Uncharacterized protein n=1 Tax=Gossypium arboreum TaxID=29729 RepID=A0ABR0P1E1_GOSAR|nr:hypothetical protein PVK06_027866 [Gossypium arboreum]
MEPRLRNKGKLSFEDGGLGQSNHESHLLASSSKTHMHATKKLGTSMNEITKRGFKVQKKKNRAKSSGMLLSDLVDSMIRELDNHDNILGFKANLKLLISDGMTKEQKDDDQVYRSISPTI